MIPEELPEAFGLPARSPLPCSTPAAKHGRTMTQGVNAMPAAISQADRTGPSGDFVRETARFARHEPKPAESALNRSNRATVKDAVDRSGRWSGPWERQAMRCGFCGSGGRLMGAAKGPCGRQSTLARGPLRTGRARTASLPDPRVGKPAFPALTTTVAHTVLTVTHHAQTPPRRCRQRSSAYAIARHREVRGAFEIRGRRCRVAAPSCARPCNRLERFPRA